MADEEAEGSSPSFSSTIEKLSRLVRLPQYDKQQAKMLVNRIVATGDSQGFTDQQATTILQLALRGSTHTGRSINSSISLLLLRSIHPAKDHQFGEDFVLTIVGALGPAEDAVVDANSKIAAATSADDEYPSSEDESDENGGLEKRNQNRRLKLAVKVQAAAIRLLVLLLKPPPAASLQLDDKGNEPADGSHFPGSFLTSRARRTLDRCYDVLFHFLDYQTLRPYLCHILSMTTRRKHVRHHRIVKLLSLRDSTSEDAHLAALIATCSKYIPNSYLAKNAIPPSSRQSDSHPGGIRYPDSRWLLQVYSVWSRVDGEGIILMNGERVLRKRRKTSGVSQRSDQVHRALTSSLLPAPSVLSAQEGSILLTDIMSYKGLGYAFDRLQLPSHLVCALGHDMLAAAIFAQDPRTYAVESAMARISDWAISAISEEINLPSSKLIRTQDQRPRTEISHRKCASLLLPLGECVERMGGCTATLQRWTSRLLHESVWKSLDMEEKRAVLLIIESFVPVDWKSFYAETLEPIKTLLSTCTAHEAALIINALARLLENWVVGRNWADISTILDNQDEEVYFGIRSLSSNIDYIKTIDKTTSTTVDLTSSLLLRLPHSLEVMNASLELYECIFTESFMGLHRFHLPARYPLHLLSLTQHGSISTLSRLFGVMRQIFDLHVEMGGEDDLMDESMVSTKGAERLKTSQQSFNSDDAKDAFNNCSVYLTDLVWRTNAFGPMHKGDFYDFGPPKDFFQGMTERCFQRGDELIRIGSMTHGATLGPLMEAHANAILGSSSHSVQGPITPYVLEKASRRSSTKISYTPFRDRHLRWLADRRATGLTGFFYSTISRFREVFSQGYSSRYEESMAISGY